MSLINCDKISLSYDSRTVISDLSFSVEQGDYLCIIGENGSGKSTLIKALLGLKSPSSGKIKYGDGLKSSEIGYLPQRSANQNDFPALAFEVVLSGRLSSNKFHPFYTKADKEAALFNLSRLGISDLKNRSFSELSGGQQQRVLLARALCATKKLILLDEPISGLDHSAASEFYSIIKKINSEGITVIMVSHDLVPALSSATKVLQLNDGHYKLSPPSEFIDSLIIKEEK